MVFLLVLVSSNQTDYMVISLVVLKHILQMMDEVCEDLNQGFEMRTLKAFDEDLMMQKGWKEVEKRGKEFYYQQEIFQCSLGDNVFGLQGPIMFLVASYK